jgi:hypothetical protein
MAVPAWKQALLDKARKKKDEHDAAVAEEQRCLALWTKASLAPLVHAHFDELLPYLEPNTTSDGLHVRSTDDADVFVEFHMERGGVLSEHNITRAEVEDIICTFTVSLRQGRNTDFLNHSATTQGAATLAQRKKW